MMRSEKLEGVPVDFSHGDVDAFPPTPGSEAAWKEGFSKGAAQAYPTSPRLQLGFLVQ